MGEDGGNGYMVVDVGTAEAVLGDMDGQGI